MSAWKLAAVALVCGLVFCGAANAATLTISIEVADMAGTVIDPATLTTAQDFQVKVYADVTPEAGDGFYGIGTAYVSVYTPNSVNVANPVAFFGKVKTAAVNVPGYSTINASLSDLSTANGGGAGADAADPDADIDAYNTAFFSTGVADFSSGLIQTQTWHTTGEAAELAVYFGSGAGYWNLNTGTITPFNSLVAGQSVTIGAGSENIAPTVALPDGDVGEFDWSREGGWNNLAHSVTVTAAGDDEDGDNGALTYEWTMMKPGGGSKVLSETGAVLNLTLAELESLGLPAYVGEGDASYNWTLSVTANDGTDTSAAAQIGVFVPEPTTMGLLGFGVLALLKRRRA